MNTNNFPRRRERNNERITITLPPSLYDAIQADAFRLHTSPADLFRTLYRSWKQAQQEAEKQPEAQHSPTTPEAVAAVAAVAPQPIEAKPAVAPQPAETAA